jgi:hypothetical protein
VPSLTPTRPPPPRSSADRPGAAPPRGRPFAGIVAALVGLAVCAGGCKAKASASQCDQLLERYATLVVTEKHDDASAAQIHDEQQREKSEARSDDAFKNCSSEVSQAEFECALRAPTADAFEKCLE